MKTRSLIQSIGCAASGVWYALATQRNMRIHLCAGTLALVAGAICGIGLLEMGVLVLTVLIVWAAELVNTSIEVVVDMVAPHHNELARVAKNVAAGAVLVCAGGSILVGLLIFLPHICRFLS